MRLVLYKLKPREEKERINRKTGVRLEAKGLFLDCKLRIQTKEVLREKKNMTVTPGR